MKSVVDLLCQKVGGDWLLTGGSLVLLEFGGQRATQDIDLVSMGHARLSPTQLRTEFFQAAKSVGLTPEQMNSAADYFVKQCEGWEQHVVEIAKGPAGRVFRPDLTLFLALKLRRGTPEDVADCELAVSSCAASEFSSERFMAWTDAPAQKRFAEKRAHWKL